MVASAYPAGASRSTSPSSSLDGDEMKGRRSSIDGREDTVRLLYGHASSSPSPPTDLGRPPRWSSGTTSAATSAKSALAVGALLTVYFALNLGLTFYNKSLLSHFPYPYFITALHTGSGVVGCGVLRLFGVGLTTTSSTSNAKQAKSTTTKDDKELVMPPKNGDVEDEGIEDVEDVEAGPKRTHARSYDKATHAVLLLLYSSLYAANIVVSNASLSRVSVALHQVIRSTCPLFTLVLGLAMLRNNRRKRLQSASLLALVPVVGGAAVACVGELSFTSIGFLLTILGTVLAALKTVTTNLLQGGGGGGGARSRALQMSALQLLELMSPLACAQCLLLSYSTGELTHVLGRLRLDNGQSQWPLLIVLAANGGIAFALNIVSFRTNRIAGPLTMTVVGNAKQVVTVALAVHVYGTTLDAVNVCGVVVSLLGTAWYGWAEKQNLTTAGRRGG